MMKISRIPVPNPNFTHQFDIFIIKLETHKVSKSIHIKYPFHVLYVSSY